MYSYMYKMVYQEFSLDTYFSKFILILILVEFRSLLYITHIILPHIYTKGYSWHFVWYMRIELLRRLHYMDVKTQSAYCRKTRGTTFDIEMMNGGQYCVHIQSFSWGHLPTFKSWLECQFDIVMQYIVWCHFPWLILRYYMKVRTKVLISIMMDDILWSVYSTYQRIDKGEYMWCIWGSELVRCWNYEWL